MAGYVTSLGYRSTWRKPDVYIRGDVDVKAWAPDADLGMVVGAVVGENDMHVDGGRDVDPGVPEKAGDLLKPVAAPERGDHYPGGDRERGEEGRGLMALFAMPFRRVGPTGSRACAP